MSYMRVRSLLRRYRYFIGLGVVGVLLMTRTMAQTDRVLPDEATLSAAEEATEAQFGQLSEGGYLVDRFEAREAFRGYMNSEDYEQAVDAARLGLELTEARFGVDDPELVPYINDLGVALISAGQPTEASAVYLRGVEIAESRLGVFDAALVQPLTGLGLALQRAGDHAQAIHALQRAQHVTHRSDGVYSLNQIPIIDAQVESYLAQDRWSDAESVKSLGLQLYRRKFGVESTKTVPAMYRLARWYHDIGDFRQARIIYHRSLAVQAEASGGDSLDMLPGLRGLSATYLDERGPDFVRGLRAYERIVTIIEDNVALVSDEERIMAHLELADWYVQVDDERNAWDYYRRAWELSRDVRDSKRDWSTYLAKPRIIYAGIAFSLEFVGFEKVGEDLHSRFAYSIGRNGRPKNIELKETTLYGRSRHGGPLRRAAESSFRFARFRPSIIDGETVETHGHRVQRRHQTTPAPDYGWDRVDKLLETKPRWDMLNPEIVPF